MVGESCEGNTLNISTVPFACHENASKYNVVKNSSQETPLDIYLEIVINGRK